MQSKYENVAVLVPCYNEEITIRKVVEDWAAALPGASIYVYDNNSSDRTSEIAKSAGAIVRKEGMQGKGNVVRRMFREIEADCYIMVDGDDTYPADKAVEMVEAVLNDGIDMVVGDRLSSTYFQENKRPFHNFGNSLVRFSINKLFRSNIKDIMTGLRAFSYNFVKTFPVLSKGFEIETEMTIHALSNNMHIKNIIIDYRDRPEGSVSKLNTIKDGVKVLKTIFKLFKNCKPMVFFNALSFVLFCVAVGLFIPILHTYTITGLVPKLPTLVVSGFIGISSMISFFTGVILDVLREKDRKDFEFKLQMIRKGMTNDF